MYDDTTKVKINKIRYPEKERLSGAHLRVVDKETGTVSKNGPPEMMDTTRTEKHCLSYIGEKTDVNHPYIPWRRHLPRTERICNIQLRRICPERFRRDPEGRHDG